MQGLFHKATMKAEKKWIMKETGIKDFPAMTHVQSLNYAQSLPWEWFHLLLDNIIPNLIDCWAGNFKDLGEGAEEFEIAPHIWK